MQAPAFGTMRSQKDFGSRNQYIGAKLIGEEKWCAAAGADGGEDVQVLDLSVSNGHGIIPDIAPEDYVWRIWKMLKGD